MPYFDDSIDDQPLQDFCDGFTGGQASNRRSNRLDANQSLALVNVQIDRTGLLSTRRGTVQLGSSFSNNSKVQGMAWYGTPTFEYLVAVVNGGLQKWDGSTWASWSAYSTGTSSRVCLTVLQQRLYLADGDNNIFSWDGTTLTDLGGGGGTQPPADASIVLAYTNRLFVAGIQDDPEAIHLSDFASPPTWDTSGSTTKGVLRVGRGDGDPITALAPWEDMTLIVFKRNSVWLLDCNPLTNVSDMNIRLLSRTTGCLGQRLWCQVGHDIWFLSETGMRSVRRTLAGDTQEITLPMSEPVQDVFDSINLSYIENGAMTCFSNHVLLSAPTDYSIESNTIIVFNTLTATWSGTWTQMPASVFAVSNFNGLWQHRRQRN
jgi:hypothetical protein